MQAFRLINGPYADRLIIFNSLPARLLNGIKTKELSGLPRRWATYLSEIGSTRKVMKTETTKHPDLSYTYKYTPIGFEPCFYVLEHRMINSDKEAWRAISEYIRMNVGPEVRLRENLEDMAVPMANNQTAPLEMEPEDVPVIPLPDEVKKEVSGKDIITHEDPVIVTEESMVPKKKPGRPKKVAVEA